MVSISGMAKGNAIPKIISTVVFIQTVFQGSGKASLFDPVTAVNNIGARVTGTSIIPGATATTGQTVIGSPGWQFQLKPEILTGAGMLIADLILSKVKFSFPGKSMVKRYILKPVGSGLLGGGIINVLLGDPDSSNSPTTNIGSIGQRAGRTALGAYSRYGQIRVGY